MHATTDIDAAPDLAAKVAFLSQPSAYPGQGRSVSRRETHMSWVFFVDGSVFKLKKPVRFAYLDFSTLARREAACRMEYALNQRLAPEVYVAVVPLVRRDGALALGGPGDVVDWLVEMRRLDETRTLESRLAAGDLSDAEVDALAATLSGFYRHAHPVRVAPAAHLAAWRAAIDGNLRILLEPRLGLPPGCVRGVAAVQRRFLRVRRHALAAVAARGRVVDAHGDLRPEHVWMGPPIKIIDRLEFDATLRAVDPMDEIAFLDLETERLGGAAVGRRLRRRVSAALHAPASPDLYLFYRIYRAMLRARLSIAHLLEPNPRTPEKWPRQARAYLALAARDARRLDRRLSRPAGR